jgi:hypothetical protein
VNKFCTLIALTVACSLSFIFAWSNFYHVTCFSIVWPQQKTWNNQERHSHWLR